jgi:hypothetical protein
MHSRGRNWRRSSPRRTSRRRTHARRSRGQRRTRPAFWSIKRQQQRGIARRPGLAPPAIAFEASGNLDAPGIRIRKNIRVRGRGVPRGEDVPWDGGIPAGGLVRQSARHQSGRSQVAIIRSSKNASSQSQAKARMPQTTRMRSFASPAARVLRSVRSRWQTGWRRAHALALIAR